MQRIFFLCLFIIPLNAALATNLELDEPNKSSWWVNLGFIGSTAGEDVSGDGGLLSLSLNNRYGLITIRNSSYNDGTNTVKYIFECMIEMFSGGCDERNVTSKINEWAVLYGKSYNKGKFSISTGIAQVKRENILNTPGEYTVLGLPIELNWRPVIGNSAGIGVTLIGNLNKKESFAGIYLTFQLGKLK